LASYDAIEKKIADKTDALSLTLFSSPTPLDCLVVANLFVALYTLAPSNPLRRAVEADQVLKEYIDRVMKRGEHGAQARAAEKVEGTS
jgi:hypothetical protein